MLKTVKNNQRRKKKGFTLIELIIVIAIIGILALIAIPRFGAVRKNANVKADIANAKTIHDATATLIAQGDIVVGSTEKTLDLTVADDQTTLKKSLQTIPTPRLDTSAHFTATIGIDGSITVKTVNSSTTKKVYPDGESEYSVATN